ncbi:MAG: hypothetical protein Q9174_003912 [Haloplaca sp. 1 TL-2023]
MGRTTRATRKLREAEGMPPSPQQELPQEPRRSKTATSSNKTTKPTISKEKNKSSQAKKATSKKTKKDAGRTAVTPESDASAPNPQGRENPSHALREGNVGGYVESVPSTIANSEPLDLLAPAPPFPYAHHELNAPMDPALVPSDAPVQEGHVSPGSQPEVSKFEQIANSVGIYRSPPSAIGQGSAENVHTSPHSVTVSPIMNPIGESTPLSTQKTQDAAATPAQANDTSEHNSSIDVTDSGFQRWFDALGNHGLQTENTPPRDTAKAETPKKQTPKESPKPPSRPVSAQEIHPPHIWRPLGLYMFRSELALDNGRSTLIINLGEDRHIRVQNITAEALHDLTSMLHAQGASFERSWLTDVDKAAALVAATAQEEARKASAAALAVEEARKASAKRKRDEEEADKAEEERKAKSRKRRKVDATPTPTFRMRRMRKEALKGRPALEEWKRTHPEQPVPPVEGNTYNRNGDLQLIGPFSPDEEEDEAEESDGIELSNNLFAQNEMLMRMRDEASSNQQLTEGQVPVTPLSPLKRLFNSARQLIPIGRRPQLLLPAPQTVQPASQTVQPSSQMTQLASQTIQPAVPTESIDHRQYVVPGAIDPPEPVVPGVIDQPEASVQDQQIGQVNTDSGLAERLHNARKSQKKLFRNKETIEELQSLRAMRNRMTREWDEIEKERQIQAQTKKDIDAAHRAAYAAQESEESQETGTKRKLRISPTVIPNPSGASYGFDTAYFDTSYSEEDAELDGSPPSKRQRRDSSKSPEPNAALETLDEASEPEPMTDLIELLKRDRSQDPNRVGPILKFNNFFALLPDEKEALAETPEGAALHYKGAHFSDSPPNPFDQSTFQTNQVEREARREARRAQDRTPTRQQIVQPDGTVLRMSDERFNNSGHFEVPFDSSSSEGDTSGLQDTTFEHQSPLKPATQQSEDIGSSGAATSGPAMPATQQPSLSPGQTTDQSTAGFKPAETPAPKESATIFGHVSNTEASKTLERSRALLREKLAGQTGRTLMSPKDILPSPTKAVSFSQPLTTPAANNSTSSALAELAKFPSPKFGKDTQVAAPSIAQPSTDQPDQTSTSPANADQASQTSSSSASADQANQASSSSENTTGQSSNEAASEGSHGADDFSIMGAASRTSPEAPPKSPGHRLAATLPTMQSQVSDLTSYKDFAQEMDPKVKEYLESVWSKQDDSTAKGAFALPFTSYLADMQNEAQEAQKQKEEESVFDGDDAADSSDDDYEWLYGLNGPVRLVKKRRTIGGTDGSSDDYDDANMGNAYDFFTAGTADQQVKDLIDGHWTAEAKTLADKKFSDEYAAWMAATTATEISQA